MLATQTRPISEYERPTDGEALVSPFGAASLAADQEQPVSFAEAYAGPALASPFGEAMVAAGEAELESLALETVLNELRDEAFDEAVQGLVDEAAARHLASTATWSSESEAPQLAASEVETWIGGIAAETDRLIERLEQQFAQSTYETFDEAFFEAEGLRYVGEAGGLSPATEQFLGGLVRKAKKLVKGAVNLAKKGIKAVGKLLPVGKVFEALRKLVQPLLKRVLRKAIGRLPAAVQPFARTLAGKLFGSAVAGSSQSGAPAGVAPSGGPVSIAAPPGAAPDAASADEPAATEITEAFDAQLAEALTASSDGVVQQLVEQAEFEANAPTTEVLGDLDAARARLARQLEAATPGVSPVAEVEQFIPVVMAALPIIRIGMKIVGRDKIVRFLADKLAGLIKGHIGPQAAQALARPLVDIGLRMLTLEAEAPGAAATLGAEAIVGTLEDTVRTLAELPAEAFSDPVRLEAETHEAFTAAVARHVPRAMLAPNLPAVETAQDHGVWVYMPRVTRPCYRYKKFTRVFQVPIARPTARAVRYPDGDTLERRLLDAGARVWPVQAEVHLYETLPGSQLGHLAAFETEHGAEAAAETALEFEELTPEMASMLVGEPGLGEARRSGAMRSQRRRLVRIVVPGGRVRRRRRFSLRLDVAGAAPALRLHLRLSERESHEMAGALAKKAHAQVVTQIKTLVSGAFKDALASRLSRHLAEKAGAPVPPDRPAALAEAIANGVTAVVSAKLPQSETALADAAKDAARGVTLTFGFAFADKAALVSGAPAAPTMTVRPGWHRD